MAVVVTRPEHQADSLVRMIEAQGAQAIRFPAISITAIDAGEDAISVVDRLHLCAALVFMSPNAVRYGVALVRSRRAFPVEPIVAAVGAGTALALAESGLSGAVHPPERQDSEGLLDLPEFARESVTGRTVAIFKGESGRGLFSDELRRRGATVEYVDVYRRERPQADAAALMRHPVDAIIVTSTEGLHNLFALLGDSGRAWLRDRDLIVASPRIADAACELGVSRSPLVANGASDAELLATLRHWRSRREQHQERKQ